MKKQTSSKSILLLMLFLLSLSTKSIGQYTEKQLKRLDKMDIKAALYEPEVNKPLVSNILIKDRSNPKTLNPGIALSAISVGFFAALLNYSNGSPAIEAPLLTFGVIAGGGSVSLYTISIVKRSKRNRLIKQLRN